MTVYAKIENNKLITAYNGYNSISGFADNIELMENEGFRRYHEDEISGYFAGTFIIKNGEDLIDISDTQEYKDKIKRQEIQQANEIRKKAIDNISNSVLLDQLALRVGMITQEVYDSRFTAKANMYGEAVHNFYTSTGLTPPTTIEV